VAAVPLVAGTIVAALAANLPAASRTFLTCRSRAPPALL